MTTLAKLQEMFQNAVLQKNPSPLSSLAIGHFGVYQEAYSLRLQSCLLDDFPKLATLLGEEAFETMSLAYLKHCPSQHFSIRYFGHALASFLCNTMPYAQQPVLGEMANFEWHLRGTLDAPNAPVLTQGSLHALAPEQWATLSFHLHPCATTLLCAYNTPALWLAIEQEEKQQSPRLEESPTLWRLWRKDQTAYFKSCNTIEAFILQSIEKGHSFATLCEDLCAYLPETEVPPTLVQLLSILISEGFFSKIGAIK